jgi:DNA-binding transcriptional LysR family regulator
MEFARPMQLRHLRYFVALAHHRHFARAAAECGVSQPTLSAGLAALEQDLGKRLVERDRRFIGLTPQGQAMLPWAQQILGAMGSMAQAVAAIAAPLAGPFRLAAIPAALPLVGRFGDALLHRHPGLHLMVHQATSRAIEQDLQALSCDAGLTYLDHEPPAHVVAVPLAQERYLFVTRRDGGFRRGDGLGAGSGHAVVPAPRRHAVSPDLDAQFAARGSRWRPAPWQTAMSRCCRWCRPAALPRSFPMAMPRCSPGWTGPRSGRWPAWKRAAAGSGGARSPADRTAGPGRARRGKRAGCMIEKFYRTLRNSI